MFCNIRSGRMKMRLVREDEKRDPPDGEQDEPGARAAEHVVSARGAQERYSFNSFSMRSLSHCLIMLW